MLTTARVLITVSMALWMRGIADSSIPQMNLPLGVAAKIRFYWSACRAANFVSLSLVRKLLVDYRLATQIANGIPVKKAPKAKTRWMPGCAALFPVL